MDRILTTHVGSLLRPAELMPALNAAERGEQYDEAAFASALDTAVTDIVRRQVEAGLDIVDDGEIGKPGFIAYLYNRVSGIEARVVPADRPDLPRGFDPEAHAGTELLFTDYWLGDPSSGKGTAWVCTGPVAYDSSAVERDIANLRRALTGLEIVDAFIPAVAPGSIYWMRNEYYATEEEFLFAIADALHEEYERIVDAGFLLSIDDPVLWHKHATMRIQGHSPADYRAWAELRVEAVNHALKGIAADRVRYHVCSGSGPTAHTQDADLREIIDLVLKVNARVYLMEQADARHEHEWRIWEEVELPDDKIVAPGVVTHQTMMVEHPELVAQRITRLARLVGRERVMASTDCGFAQEATTRRVPLWTQWAKLHALAEGARLASEELWGGKVAA
jgi:5-methyltetrahydropteroyltriglutamate--homocysteine methyltransferase